MTTRSRTRSPAQKRALDELEGLRAAVDGGAVARQRAEQIIRDAKASGLLTVREIAEAYDVTEGRVYQIIAPGYRA